MKYYISIMFESIGHQTLEDRDNADEIEDNGPFAANEKENAYLGSGYYFWDDHIELAKWWGETRYKGNYIVCEGIFKVPTSDLFDLVGSRKHQKLFKELLSVLDISDMPIGKAIEYLKKLESLPHKKGIFPFKVIRAVDITKNSKYPQEIKEFAENKQGKMSLSPMIAICLVEKNIRYLPSYTVLFPDKYVDN